MPNRKAKYRPKALAIERNASQTIGWWRYARTVALGTIALTLGVIWIGEQYGVDRRDVLEFFATGLLFVGVLVVAALVFLVAIIALRRLLRK